MTEGNPTETQAAREVLLTPRAAAARLGVKPRTLARWADLTLLTVRRTFGGHRRYLETEIDAFAEERERKAQARPRPVAEAVTV